MRYLLIYLCLFCLVSRPARAAKSWRTYENCTLLEGDYYDGDSFHVKCKTRTYIFRLYFVDTPESDDSFEDRVQEQADYWGITPKDAVKLGKIAAKFTQKFLKKEFTVYSKLANARGRSDQKRYYAMITNHDGEDVGVALVENGLARVYGMGTILPDGTSEKTYWWRLKNAEGRAKKNRLGGWGMPKSSMGSVVPSWVRPAAKIPTQQQDIPSGSDRVAQSATSAFSAQPAQADVPLGPAVLPRTAAVFSLLDATRQVGILKAGAQVDVLGLENTGMVRIRFATGEGKKYEAQCRRDVLGI